MSSSIRLESLMDFIIIFSVLSAVSAAVLVVFLANQRRCTRRLLESCGLPTVLWKPRFVHYSPSEDASKLEKKLSSSSITRILPRMERLGGPFGMYGTVYGISTPYVHVAHPIPARSILMGTVPSSERCRASRRVSISDSSGATKGAGYNNFKDFTGNGVFTADSEDWKEKRASVIHCLLRGISKSNSEGSQRLEREANAAADTVIAELERIRENERQPDNSIRDVNVVPVLQKATIGLIYRFITHDVDPSDRDCSLTRTKGSPDDSSEHRSVSSSSTSLSSLASSPTATKSVPAIVPPPDICSLTLLKSYMASVVEIRMIILAQTRSFWFLFPRWVYRRFSAMHRVEEKILVPIRAFAARACDRAKPGSPLAQLQQRPSHAHHANEKGRFSKAILDEAITQLFAGQDTSAATLSWTLHLLSLHRDIQTRVAEEVRSVLALHNDETERADGTPFLTKKLISKMPVLDAVIKESMRLYPVAPFVVRKLNHPVEVKEGQEAIILPSGTFSCIWIYGLHRNSKFWHRPDDFIPDRWLDPKLRALDVGQATQCAYMPFAAGPRNCVGQPLAHVILRVLLARILYHYEFRDERLTEPMTVNKRRSLRKDMQAGFTVLPSGGVRLTVGTR